MKTILRLPLVALLLVALVACGSNKSSSANSNGTSGAGNGMGAAASAAPAENGNAPMEAATGMPDCGSDQTVWVNLKSHVYHEQGSPLYGKTKHGQYMCLSQARADGFHPPGAGARHHRRGSESSDSTDSM